MKALEILRSQFNNHVALHEKRPNVQQLYAPLYHEDGDMIDIFFDLPHDAELVPGQTIRV
jgi:hypothetical protein